MQGEVDNNMAGSSKKLGKFLVQYRRDHGLSQTNLAAAIGTSAQTVWRLEQGEMAGLDILQKIAQVTGVSLRQVLQMLGFKVDSGPSDSELVQAALVFPESQRILELLRDMGPEQQRELVRYAEFVKARAG